MLASEIFFRQIPNRRALAHYGDLTGSPDESGQKRREKGLARAGNIRIRNGLIQFAWRFLKFQSDSELARWFRQRTVGGPVGPFRRHLKGSLFCFRSGQRMTLKKAVEAWYRPILGGIFASQL